MKNNSPWIHQLNKERKINKLGKDVETDIVVVGGGIAGISTAFFVLRNTSQRVILVEGGQIGHGATGHNGGQLVSYFPRSLQDLAGEFGLEKSAEAHDNIENDAWELLNIMYTEAKLDIPLSRFMGHLGLSNKEQLLSVLEDNHLRRTAGLKPKEILIAEHVDFAKELEIKYPDLFRLVSHEEILEKLETKQPRFIACLSEQKGCMNSALFVEKVAEYLLEKYQNRFSLYEHTHISKVVLHDDQVILDADTHTVTAKKVVLCTNGFDSLTIFNKSGLDIDTHFHHSLHAIIGYMSGYLEEPTKPPMAINYLYDDLSGDDSSGAPYIYLTRRAYEYPSDSRSGNNSKHNLISIGGPDRNLEDRKEYEKDHEYPEWARDEIDGFVRSVYADDPRGEIDYLFTWHGLMDYTASKLRLIGAEPKNPALLYNLGCNGVGLLPSIFGGEKISKIIDGESLPSSIFDPRTEV